MSGYICGRVVFDNQELDRFDETFSHDIINQYKLDRFDYSSLASAQFGCGLIHITEEAKFEKLPFYDRKAGLYITADVILDNRDDLIRELSLNSIKSIVTDGYIVLEAYKRWRYDTPKHLLGDFAFAIWDIKKQELFLTRDHTGTRSLYYTKNNTAISFSTTINPLIGRACNNQKSWNEEWLTMYFALPDGSVDYDSNLTMYSNVFQCPIAHSLVITQTEIRKLEFWDPLQLINEKSEKISKSEWLESFNTTYNEAVKCRIRSSGNVGIFLSGGLDSTSVAAIAANQLKSDNKNLHSFTSIPLYEVDGYNHKYDIVNEKKDVELFVSHFPNILPNYLDCVDQDILSSADELIKIIEMPFKAIQNLTWIHEIYKKADNLGCKIMLKGQFGNVTISKGAFLVHIQTLKKHGRYFEILREVEAISKLHCMPRRVVLKKIINTNIPEAVKKITRKSLERKRNLYNPYLEYMNEDLLSKYRIVEKLKSKKLYEYSTQNPDFYEEGTETLNEMVMTLVGTYDTKFGLRHGLITRDPTKDIRVIEFCLRAPYELFVEQGIERKFIRDAMENIVPDEIRLNYFRRGLQGIDWDKRISQNKMELFRQLESLNNNQIISHYLKQEKVEKILGYGSEIFETQHVIDLRQAIYWIIIGKILVE